MPSGLTLLETTEASVPTPTAGKSTIFFSADTAEPSYKDDAGDVFPLGTEGPQGPQGFQGSAGPQGTAGAQGAQGAQGDDGAQGPQGDDTIPGPQGPQGDAGAQGPQGTAGAAGAQGASGAQGAAGAQGAQGSQGAQGAAGAAGSQGPQGTQGTQGATGSAGSAGAQGPQGDAGATGSQGNQGNQGTQGAQGAQGAQGSQGAQGNQGSQGNQGFQGNQGAQGTQGVQGAQGSAVVLTEAPADQAYTGTTVALTYGESLVPGDVVYFKSDGKVYKADADGSGTYPAIGIALETASSGSHLVLLDGIYRDDTRYNWTVGGLLYLSTTAGSLTQTQPSATDNVIQVMGIATHADRILLRPHLVYLTHT